MTSGDKKRGAKYWLRLSLQLLSLILFGLLLWWGGTDAWQHILSGNPQDILIACLLLGMASILAAFRLKLMSRAVTGQNLGPWRRFYYVNMTTRAAGLIIPRSLSTFAGKPVALGALGTSIKRAFWTVLLDNSFDLILLGAWLPPSLFFLRDQTSALEAIILATGSTLLLTCGIWWATAAGRLSPVTNRLKRIPWIATILPIRLDNIEKLMPSRSIVLQSLGLSVLINSVLAARYHYIAQAVGLTYPWPIFVASFPITQLSLVLAVTPGGLGVFDASWYGVLLLGGVSHQDAITFVIAQRAYIFIFVLIWAGVSTLLSLIVKEQEHA
jgi:uncharacterized membrane protein YbhN (UPF0104 family)